MPYSQTLPLHLKGVREVMVATGAEFPNLWKYIVGKELSTNAIAEKMVLMSGLATAQPVGDGAQVQIDQITTPYAKTFPTQMYAIGVVFTEKQMKTDQSGKLRKIAKEFAYSLYLQKETMVADLINNGTDGTNYPGIDGVALFSNSHPFSGGTYSNLSTPAALDATSLKQALIDRKSHKTLKGQPWLRLGPVNLVVPAELEFVAEVLVSSTQEPGTADNDSNKPIRRMVNWTPGNPFLTDTNGWTLVPADGDSNPLFYLNGAIENNVREDFFVKSYEYVMTAAQDHTVGWLYPAGVQHNVGA